MKYSITRYGAPVLGQKTADIPAVDDSIRRLAKDMLIAMYESNGVGLAAPQIGRSENICVIDVSGMKSGGAAEAPLSDPPVKMPLILINPRIVAEAGEEKGQEGCLSVPEVFADIRRAAEVTVVFRDLEMKEVTLKARGILARAVQHELDHLAGRLIVDRMSVVQRLGVAGKLKRLRKEAGAE